MNGGSWLGGHGVHVRSNGSDESTDVPCNTALSYVHGVLAGSEWQCVELVNRLYLSRGWINATWTGDAGAAFWSATPANLTKEAEGAVSYLGPGDVVDVVESYKGIPVGGHVFIVDTTKHVSSGSVNLVSQNNGNVPSKPGAIAAGKVIVSGAGGGWTYRVVGVIHAPVS